MRILHTSDWHLGHTLAGLSRRFEHQRFFEWLLALCVAEQIDVLIIAGDIFDSANPPASAFEDFYGLLAHLRHARPSLELVIVGGNHDSPARLEAPHPLMKALGITVVGALPRRSVDEGIDWSRVVVPLHDKVGQIRAYCVALPYLRPADLSSRWLRPPHEGESTDPWIEGIREIYADAVHYARSLRAPGQAIIATGHCYMAHTRLSELSERKILGGNLHALSADVVPDDICYLALGHLHLAQTVANNETRRYCGAPIPLHADEANYPHQVVVVTLDGEQVSDVETKRVPKAVPFVRIPAIGAGVPDDVFAEISALAGVDKTVPVVEWPYLDIRVLLTAPMPDLRTRIEMALVGKMCRLLKITTETPAVAGALGDTEVDVSLVDMDPEVVFKRLYERRYVTSPSPELMAAFHEILHQVNEQETVR